MVCCAVTNCKNTSARISKNKDGITFHRFPRDDDRKRQWEIAVNREDWSASVSSAVCSEHFEARNFYITTSGLRRLSVEAVPTLNISPCQEQEQTIANILPIYVKPTDSEEVIKLKYEIKRLEAIAEKRKRRLNLMWQGRRRLKKKLDKMKCIIKHLISHRHGNGKSEKLGTETDL